MYDVKQKKKTGNREKSEICFLLQNGHFPAICFVSRWKYFSKFLLFFAVRSVLALSRPALKANHFECS